MSKTFKVGDRVKVVCDYKNGITGTISKVTTFNVRVLIDGYPYEGHDSYHGFGFHELELIERKGKPMEYKTWGEMTREEKGELLLAHHEGKTIQCLSRSGNWIDDEEYPEDVDPSNYWRVKPEPVVKTVVMYGGLPKPFSYYASTLDTHKITFDVVDGVVDCNSVKMEEL